MAASVTVLANTGSDPAAVLRGVASPAAGDLVAVRDSVSCQLYVYTAAVGSAPAGWVQV